MSSVPLDDDERKKNRYNPSDLLKKILKITIDDVIFFQSSNYSSN